MLRCVVLRCVVLRCALPLPCAVWCPQGQHPSMYIPPQRTSAPTAQRKTGVTVHIRTSAADKCPLTSASGNQSAPNVFLGARKLKFEPLWCLRLLHMYKVAGAGNLGNQSASDLYVFLEPGNQNLGCSGAYVHKVAGAPDLHSWSPKIEIWAISVPTTCTYIGCRGRQPYV